MAQRLKHLPGMWETLVQSLDWEDPLEKEMATHSNTLAWRIPWREEPGRLPCCYIIKILIKFLKGYSNFVYKAYIWTGMQK